MRLSNYKQDATELFNVPSDTPLDELLRLARERLPVVFDEPKTKLDKARLVQAIGRRFVGDKYHYIR